MTAMKSPPHPGDRTRVRGRLVPVLPVLAVLVAAALLACGCTTGTGSSPASPTMAPPIVKLHAPTPVPTPHPEPQNPGDTLNGTWIYRSSSDMEYLLIIAANGTYASAFRPVYGSERSKTTPGPGGRWARTAPWEYNLTGGATPITLLYDAEEDLLIIKEDPKSRFFREGRNSTLPASGAAPESPIYHTAEIKAHVAEKMTDLSEMSKGLVADRQSRGFTASLAEFDRTVNDEMLSMNHQVLPLSWDPFRGEYLDALSRYSAAVHAYRQAQVFDMYSSRWQDLMGEGTRYLLDGDARMGTAAAKLPGATPTPTPSAGHIPRPACTGDLQVVSETMTLNEKGYGAVTGTVINCGARRFRNVKVVPSLYDRKGSMIGISMDTTDEIAPYGSWNFSASVFIPNVASYKIDKAEYASFTL